jgi:hypothetical protein
MAKGRKMWVFSPPKQPKPKVLDAVKTNVEAKANDLIETVLKPNHIKPPSGDERFNLSYMRHTGQWWEIYTELSLDESLDAIRDEPHFLP